MVGEPLIPEVGVLALPYHRFGTSWMTPHHVISRLAYYFQVVWMEPAHHWREIGALSARRAAIARLRPGLLPGLDVYVPEPWLFDSYRSRWLQRFMLKARVRRGWERLRRRGCRSQVLYLWHYQFEAALEAASYDLSLYHIDDEYSFTPDPPPMPALERRVIGAVDQVFAISPRLLERKGGINPHMAFAPEAVDYRLYSTPAPEPADLASIPHPRIGYTGTIKVQLDWHLLRGLAERYPAWSFVFVGPKRLDPETGAIAEAMERLGNVHFLGEKRVKEVAAYPQHFDACIMPYLVDNYTHNIFPLKLHEYLACGKPVIGSRIRSLLDYDAVIALAGSLDEWSEQLTDALAPAAFTPGAIAARQEAARLADWSDRTYEIARIICERLGPQYTSRLRRLVIETPI